MIRAEDIDERHIKLLPATERRRLAIVAQELAAEPIAVFVETHPQYEALGTSVFQRIATERLPGFTSVVTLSEVLGQPLLSGNTYI